MHARDEITALLAHYAHAVDDGRVDDVVGCFARDGVLAVDEHAPIVGHEALAQPFARLAHRLQKPEAGFLRHNVSSIEITSLDEDAGTATVRAYFIVMGERGLDHWGTYADELAVEDGAWRFARRVVRIEGRSDSPDLR